MDSSGVEVDNDQHNNLSEIIREAVIESEMFLHDDHQVVSLPEDDFIWSLYIMLWDKVPRLLFLVMLK